MARKATTSKRPKRETLLDKTMNEVVIYGGFPVRYGTMFKHLDEVAKSTGEKNWMAIRDAGLMGYHQHERMHPTKLPDDVQPLTYEELEKVTNLPSGAKIPKAIHKKIVTMYPKEERHRFEAKTTKVEEGIKPLPQEGSIIVRGEMVPIAYEIGGKKYKANAVLAPTRGKSMELHHDIYFGSWKVGTGDEITRAHIKKGIELAKAQAKKEPKSRKEIVVLKTKPVKQSDRAIAIDRALLAKQVVPVNDPRWLQRPNRFDVRGIDTPGSGRVTSRTGFTDKGKTRMSRRHHRGWKRIKL